MAQYKTKVPKNRKRNGEKLGILLMLLGIFLMTGVTPHFLDAFGTSVVSSILFIWGAVMWMNEDG